MLCPIDQLAENLRPIRQFQQFDQLGRNWAAIGQFLLTYWLESGDSCHGL
jgi:hypothetical protein